MMRRDNFVVEIVVWLRQIVFIGYESLTTWLQVITKLCLHVVQQHIRTQQQLTAAGTEHDLTAVGV